MANFCGKCGSPVEKETGLCPICDSEKLHSIKNTPRFCPDCGGAVDKLTGMCTNCAKNQESSSSEPKKPENKKQKHKKKGGSYSALTSIASVLLSLCLFVSLLCVLLIHSVRNTLTYDNAEKLFDNVEIVDILKSAHIVEEDKLNRFYAYAKLKYNVDVTDEKLDSFINRSTVKSFAAAKLSAFFDDFFDGEAEIVLSKREVISLIKSNDDIIEDKFGIRITDVQAGEIADALFRENQIMLVSSEKMKETQPTLYYSLKITLSHTTMAILLIISIVLMLIMIYNSVSQAVRGTAIDCIVLGMAGILVVLIGYFAPLGNVVPFGTNVAVLLGNVFTVNHSVYIGLVIFGIVLLIARKLVSKFQNINVA